MFLRCLDMEGRELWMKAYEAYKIALALSSDYNGTNSVESEED